MALRTVGSELLPMTSVRMTASDPSNWNALNHPGQNMRKSVQSHGTLASGSAGSRTTGTSCRIRVAPTPRMTTPTMQSPPPPATLNKSVPCEPLKKPNAMSTRNAASI